MEIGVWVETEDLVSGQTRHNASAYLTFVAMDKDFRPRPVPSLELTTAEDKRRNQEAVDRKKLKLAQILRGGK